ncbi:MAG: tripartite tricarboxylate transporter permease [Dongiaceae bacterium]
MEILQNLLFGFQVAMSPSNFLHCFIGALLGTMVGILPGVGPITAIAVLLPVTMQLDPIASLIMLAGIYYGANHAGSTTSIMLNMPGEPSSIVICLDGYPMARQGRAGPALCMAALSSFFAGCVGVIIIACFSPALVKVALSFRAPEYTCIIFLALVGTSVLSGKSLLNAISMSILGLLVGTIGTDVNSGVMRFTAGDIHLAEGVNFVAVILALFAFTDICMTLGSPEMRVRVKTKLRDLMPSWADIKACIMPTLRGTSLGAALGILPGTGPMVSSFGAYAIEKKLAKEPARFGKGAIEGVAAPEAAANAAAFTHFVPMLALGIPAGATMALLLGAMLIQGIIPGPEVMTKHPDLFWGLVGSMWIGNLMLLILNLPLVGVWIKMLETPYRFIYPLIVVFCLIGVYSDRLEAFDVYACAVLVGISYVLTRLDCPAAPFVIGLVLGPILEENLRRAMLIARGDPTVFITRPISLAILLLMVGLVTAGTLPALRRKREKLS